MPRVLPRVLAVPTLFLALCGVCVARPARADSTVVVRDVDRIAVRFVTPETGGAGHPRFLTERELAFYARIEALLEQTPLEPGDYPERYVRAAVDRLVARSMLSTLMSQRGELPSLAQLTAEAREELETRLGGAKVLADAMRREGIEEEELLTFLGDEVRAAHYVDRAISPILSVTEEALREAFRSSLHPFRGAKFDEVRLHMRRWLVSERLRAAEVEFFQGARSRIRVTSVRSSASTAASVP